MPETAVLADMLDSSRALTLYYLKHAEEFDKAKSFTVDGFNTNSILWIVCHLSWAEDFLILKGVGNKGLGVPWFEHFKLGSEYPEASIFPGFDEALTTLNTVHTETLDLLGNTDISTLDEPNHTGMKFGPSDSKRKIIHHAIRHEGMHCGQLAWLIRMHGKRVI